MATRDIGLLVIALGGGRHQATDAIDARVGFANMVQLGQRVERGNPLAVLHAADADAADMAERRLLELIEIADEAPVLQPVMLELLAD
jgi:thymidine phosphorylase